MNEVAMCLTGAAAYGLYVMGCVYLVDSWWHVIDFLGKMSLNMDQARRDALLQVSIQSFSPEDVR